MTSLLFHTPLLAALHNCTIRLKSSAWAAPARSCTTRVLEAQLVWRFRAPVAFLFNPDFVANASLFACVPHPGNSVLSNEAIHTSVLHSMHLVCRFCVVARVHSQWRTRAALLAPCRGSAALKEGQEQHSCRCGGYALHRRHSCPPLRDARCHG